MNDLSVGGNNRDVNNMMMDDQTEVGDDFIQCEWYVFLLLFLDL